jgi:hypothetical protein
MTPTPLHKIGGAVIRARPREAERMVDEVDDLTLLVPKHVAFVPVLLTDRGIEERASGDLIRYGLVRRATAPGGSTETAVRPAAGRA